MVVKKKEGWESYWKGGKGDVKDLKSCKGGGVVGRLKRV